MTLMLVGREPKVVRDSVEAADALLWSARADDNPDSGGRVCICPQLSETPVEPGELLIVRDVLRYQREPR